jgi:hypothetical protein
MDVDLQYHDTWFAGCRLMHGALAHQPLVASSEVFFNGVSLSRRCCWRYALHVAVVVPLDALVVE